MKIESQSKKWFFTGTAFALTLLCHRSRLPMPPTKKKAP